MHSAHCTNFPTKFHQIGENPVLPLPDRPGGSEPLQTNNRRKTSYEHQTEAGCRVDGHLPDCRISHRTDRLRIGQCRRHGEPDIPDLGRGAARRYAGHVRCLHGAAPQRAHRSAGHQLGRVLDQAGGGRHLQPDAGHLLDAHQRDPEVCRLRQAGGLLRHCGNRAFFRHFAGQRQRFGRQALCRAEGQGHRGPGVQQGDV